MLRGTGYAWAADGPLVRPAKTSMAVGTFTWDASGPSLLTT